MDLEKQIDFFSRSIPSHLKGIVYSGGPELNLGEGGHGEKIAIGYRLRCTCLNEQFQVAAYAWKEASLISPVSAACSNCGQSFTLFDSDIHGYDPVACDSSSFAHGQREEDAFKKNLPSSSAPGTVDIVTYYPDDLFEEDFDEFADRRGDLFTWIRIVLGEDINPEHPLLDFECA